jgi:hypothetical protein
MPLIIADRVRETTTTSGTGPITLAGPYLGFQAFSVIGNGNTTYYVIIDAPNLAWEVGIGTYASVGNTLARTTVLASSNSGSLVNLGAGPKDVILTQPARRSVLVQEGGSGLLAGTTAFTANGVPYANSSSTLTTGPNLAFDGTNFGIGTSSPAAKLDVVGSLGRVQVNLNGDQIAYSFNGYNYLTATGATATLQIQATGANGVIAFATNLAERMRITSSGNVGIGTSSPSERLRVVGTSGNVQFGAGTASNAVFINAFDSDTIYMTASASNANAFGFGSASNIPMFFMTNNTERMRIDSSGNVGIGTSSPGDKLEIGGAGAGIILASPDGTRYRITVSNLGVLTVAAV